MRTYFRLAPPENQRVCATAMEGAPEPRIETRACPLTNDHLDGSRRISDLALQVRHDDKGEWIVWSWMNDCLIHDRLLAEFTKAGLTGYRKRSALLRFATGEVCTDYKELVVTGWGGLARPESGVRVVKSCPGCHWKRYSPLKREEELIDWSQWTGEDFFFVWADAEEDPNHRASCGRAAPPGCAQLRTTGTSEY